MEDCRLNDGVDVDTLNGGFNASATTPQREKIKPGDTGKLIPYPRKTHDKKKEMKTSVFLRSEVVAGA